MIKSVHVFLIEAAKSLMPSQPATPLNEEYLVVWFKFLVKKAFPANKEATLMHTIISCTEHFEYTYKKTL